MKYSFIAGIALILVDLSFQSDGFLPTLLFYCDVPDTNISRSRNFYPGGKWPGGIVKYVLDSTLTPADQTEVFKAFADIEDKTCIKFQERSGSEVQYTRILTNDNHCGYGSVCTDGFASYAIFGKHCRNMNTMVHELSHNLCLMHEHSRWDRDDYLSYDTCPVGMSPGKNSLTDTRGYPYDYVSVMHFECFDCELGGWPKVSGVTQCGSKPGTGLAVLDADKINELYDCQGCFRHRWRSMDTLTSTDIHNLVAFGETSSGEPLYICRAAIGTEIAIGKYRAEAGICYIPFFGREHWLTSGAQVFTALGGRVDGAPGTYHTIKITPLTDVSKISLKSFVSAGRLADGMPGYVAIFSNYYG